jgi:Zn-dependent peptidase ImmA (M78 family)
MGVAVIEFSDLELTERARDILLRKNPEDWSGVTMKDAGESLVVINPSHSRGRQATTLMHELSHLMLLHVPTQVDITPTGMLLLSDYSEEAESEADWLAAAMLLPREALLKQRRQGRSIPQIAAAFGTSEQLCEWRVRMTGVDLQLKRAAGQGR